MDDKGKERPRGEEVEDRSRRAFLKSAGKATFGAALATAIFHGPLGALYAKVRFPRPDHEPLEGACAQAITDDEKTVAAVVDTVVPGPASDPDGYPGALDTCALNLIYDEFYPFVSALPFLLALVNKKAHNKYGVKFIELDLVKRTAVLKESESALPLMRLAYRFIRSAFYAANYNMVGAKHFGWPGPNLGYAEHKDFTFGKAVSKELTKDGNLP